MQGSVAKWLAKIKQRSDVSCRLCQRAREQRSASTKNLPEETYGHINNAFCNRMATTVRAAHHFIWSHLYASIQAARSPASKLRFVTPDEESSLNTLWQQKDFEQICSRELLTLNRLFFVAGRRGAVVEDDFYNNLERSNVQAGKKGQDSGSACATHMRST